MVFGKPITMRFDQIVYHCTDLINTQFGTGVRIKHCGLINIILFTSKRCIDSYLMHSDLTQV